MLITIETENYDERRHGRPWLLRITAWCTDQVWPADSEGGTWINDSPGRPGRLELEAQPGDLLRHGQRDNHCPGRSLEAWCVVKSNGTLHELIDRGTALDYWRSHKSASESGTSDRLDLSAIPTDLLVAELDRRQRSDEANQNKENRGEQFR